ncbi:hypothetical protein G6O69_16295 [Pseudenhygromyxa sp. WMMC2535]|nr:hypothetical protein [Pseudenhygromyxa sp. WMMC2535]
MEFEPDRPELSESDDPDPYTGDDEIVLEAQSQFRTGLDVHQKIIWRTCTPFDGVCHNSKEFPDLRTPANFVKAFGANCNVQYGEYESVYDRCERPGDRFRISGGGYESGQIEIGWIESIAGDYYQGEDLPPEDSPGLHIHLADPMPGEQTKVYTSGGFERTFITDGEVKDFTFANYTTLWYILPGRTHVIGEVREYQGDQVQELLSVGIIEGDANRNGTLGAREGDPIHMLSAGDPENSYLIARLRGVMSGEEVPGSRMPLANQPLSIAEMLALFCLVETIPEDPGEADLARAVDYAGCSYSADPAGLNLLGEGVTWAARIEKVLEYNCSGCHNEITPEADLALIGEGVYERLLEPSQQNPALNLIEPGEPESSYLYLKITGHEDIVGNPMPYNPLTGEGTLTQAEIADIETWIINGAIEDE